MVDTESWKNTLHRTNLTKSSILSYGVGLNPAATSYLVVLIKRTSSITGKVVSNYITHDKKGTPTKNLVWNRLTTSHTRDFIRG